MDEASVDYLLEVHAMPFISDSERRDNIYREIPEP